MKFLRGTSYRDKYLTCDAECDELKRQLETITAERDAYKRDFTILEQSFADLGQRTAKELEELKAQLEEAQKPKRTSRAKPPAAQE